MTKPIIFVNGVFDILHVGHFNLLSLACHWRDRYGGPHEAELHVAIDSDAKVKRDKGDNRPIFTQQERENALYCFSGKFQKPSGHFVDCRMVNKVHVFDSNEELENLIKRLQPLIMVKGEEWKGNVVGEEYCEQTIFYPKHIVPLSSTQIINSITKKELKRLKIQFPGAEIW